jgi:hypothetical protein
VSLLLVSVAAAFAPAQQLPTAQELATRIEAYAGQYRKNLPSFEVEESAVTQQLKGDRVKWEVRLEATMHELRDEKIEGSFIENITIRLVDGQPAPQRFNLPYFVNGVFGNALGFAGSADSWSCFERRVSPGASPSTALFEFWVKPAPLPPDCKGIFENYRKSALVDIATGRVLHLTRSMSERAAEKHHEVVFVEVDYAPQKLGEETFWLPLHFVSHNEKGDRRMEGSFSNFHRYAASVKVIESNPLPEVTP